MKSLVVAEMGPHGTPVAHVPPALLWNLVEYLSYQRVTVTYRYEDTQFVMEFPKSDLSTAERLLSDWAHSAEQALQHA